MPKIKDLSGKRFGRLIAIERTGKNNRGYSVWRCKCDCGNESTVASFHLIDGSISSCGCLRVERLIEKIKRNIDGKRFGRLTVVRRVKIDKEWMCECLCDCGNVIQTHLSSLKSGSTRSCGCLHLEQLIERSTKHGMSHTPEYRSCRDKKRRDLEHLHDSQWTVDMEIEIRKMFTRCVVCGSSGVLSIDHVIPLSKGVGLKPGNAVILCKKCNNIKWCKNPEEMPDAFRDAVLSGAKKFEEHWYHILDTRTA